MAANSDGNYILRWSKKLRAIEMLGGECWDCGNSNPIQLEFHHLSNKDQNLTKLFWYGWSKVKAEAEKCQLLCRNCHQQRHNEDGCSAKAELLKLSGRSVCEKCGYDGNISCLDFHHHGEESKGFRVSRGYITDRFVLPLETILCEMDKCLLVCRNCHALLHFDHTRFERLRGEIEAKKANYKENMPIAESTRRDILRLGESGLSVRKIAAEVGCSKSSVHSILAG